MRSLYLAALVGLCVSVRVWAGAPDTGPAHLVADLRPGFAPYEAEPIPPFDSFTAVNGRVIFQAFGSLWTTDGTAAGTSRLTELGGVWATTGSVAFFTSPSDRLWSTDGTAEKTIPLGEVTLGFGDEGIDLPLVGPAGRLFFFEGCTEAYGCEPWRSDGTPEGTLMLGDLRRGPEGSKPSKFTLDGRRVLFATRGAVWSTDGSPKGTFELFKTEGDVIWLQPHGPEIFFETFSGVWVFDTRVGKGRRILGHDVGRHAGVFPTEVGGRLLLEAFDLEVPEFFLFTTDGTRAGTRDVGPKFTSGLDDFASVGNRVVFAASTLDAVSPELDLWFLAPERTTPKRFAGCSEGCPTVDSNFGSAPFLAPFKGRLLFTGRDAQHGSELWTTDGTPRGTHLLKDLCPGACDGAPLGFQVFEDRLLFIDAKRDLWATDGTEAGTIRLAALPLLNGPPTSVDAAVIDGRIVFNGFDAQDGPQPWVSDLTPEGTARLAKIGSNLAAGSDIRAPTALGARIVFAILGSTGISLWSSDGTAADTVRLPPTDDSVGLPCFTCRDWTRLGGRLFFSSAGRLFRTDGTPDGTQPILDLGAGKRVGEPSVFGDRLLFTAGESPVSPANNPWGLWTSDGTVAGTQEFFSLPRGENPSYFMPLGGQALFFLTRGLWSTDGTAAGTQPIRDDIGEALEGGTLFHGKLFFPATDRHTGQIDFWRSDGTVSGTELLVPATALPRPLSPFGLFVFQDALYFFAFSGQSLVLWRSDGTAAGTHSVDLSQSPNGDPLFLSGSLTPLGDHLFFAAGDDVHGWRLWKTDGTAAGTVPVSDAVLPPGIFDSLAVAGNRLYFAAGDAEHGFELWTSDGTAAGTTMVQDVLPGADSSLPRSFAAANGKLFFSANDGEHGRELWALPLELQP